MLRIASSFVRCSAAKASNKSFQLNKSMKLSTTASISSANQSVEPQTNPDILYTGVSYFVHF